MKACAKMMVVTVFLAVLVPELVLSSKKAKDRHVYNLHRSNDSVSNVFTRILSGTNATHGMRPWHAQLVKTGEPHPFCGGALVDDYSWVLTAGHCVASLEKNQYTVRLGAHKTYDANFPSSYGQEFKVANTFVHPQYNTEEGLYDAALLLLDKPAIETLYVKKVQLPTAGHAIKTGDQCLFTGFGCVNDKGDRPEVMQELWLNIVTLDDCQRSYSGRLLDKSVLCAERSPGIGPSNFDSGGGLVCTNKAKPGDSNWYLYGIMSRDIEAHSLFTDVPLLLPWINKKTKVDI